MKKSKLAILASGNGSNAEAIMKWAQDSALAEVVCLGSDKKNAFALERASKYNVPTFVQLKKKSESRSEFDLRLIDKLKDFVPDWIILAGYMKLLSPVFIKRFEQRIINIHPSLLPLFPGTDGYGDAFKANVTVSGCTVHFVDEGMDTGKIVLQNTFPRLEDDSFETFKARGLKVENEFYPYVIEKLLKEYL